MLDTSKHGGETAHKFLIGNKCDLAAERTVTYQDAIELAKYHAVPCPFE